MDKKIIISCRVFFITILVIGISPILLWIRNNAPIVLEVFKRDVYNQELSYQVAALLLAGCVIGIVYWITGKEGISFLDLRKRDGDIIPEPWIAIRPKAHETWKNLGLNFAIIITGVTAVVIYFQVFRGHTINLELVPALLLVFVFAITNSFTEEIIYRFSFVAVVNKEGLSPYLAQGLAAVTFGVIHYFGTPSGIPGILMAGFIGWFLAKSMNETKGFFWAWGIHFLQDVIIFFAKWMQ